MSAALGVQIVTTEVNDIVKMQKAKQSWKSFNFTGHSPSFSFKCLRNLKQAGVKVKRICCVNEKAYRLQQKIRAAIAGDNTLQRRRFQEHQQGQKQCIIWDYQKLLPVAQVTNASKSNIAYCSFEAEGGGYWTFSGTTGIDPTAPTGQRFYNLTPAAPITKTGLSATGTYTISYWTKSSSAFTITGTQTGYPVAGRSINGWHYFEHKITGQTSVSLNGTGAIDEVRLYPFYGQMTTYAYKPLVGITSQCDVNNRITYYEYDGYNRLILIRDQDKNILKQICYNYAGQVENCGIYYNGTKSGIFTKVGCTNCQAGTSVTYVVPAQTYSASTQVLADQLGQNDVDVNGQAYANVNGSCVTPVNAALTGTNAMSQSCTVQFHNNCTNYDYPSFTISSGASNVAVTPSVPSGNYTVKFSYSGTGGFSCRVNAYTMYVASGIGSITATIASSGASVGMTP